jgi:ankyrin repeat protein
MTLTLRYAVSTSEQKGVTPLDIASHKGHLEIVKALNDKLADVEYQKQVIKAQRENEKV